MRGPLNVSSLSHFEKGIVIIALDYDDTYDRDPGLRNHLIGHATALGHVFIIVTMRYEHEPIEMALGHVFIIVTMRYEHEPIEMALAGVDVPIFYTGRQAKVPYMASLGIDVHVWIDDDPYALIDLD